MTDNAPGGEVSYLAEGPVARLTLERPKSANAFDLATARAFAAAVREAADEDVLAVCLTGRGGRFCAGGDVRSVARARDRGAHIHELATCLGEALHRLRELPKPVVAAVQGAVAGAGIAVMLSADVIVAERSTKFLMAYAAMGLTPDCGASVLLPRAVGQQRALELALTGRTLTASEALSWGLVTEVVDDGDGAARALEIARCLATRPPFALAEAKRLVRGSWDSPAEVTLADEARTIASAVVTERATALIDTFTGTPERS
ncbi:enoyl-CoA hydratase/isomerase family protein [Streptomyces sp. NPDC056716]|uniref:enoyl-CoA hydratase/isomerase family protein n=1 Tax=unclassified Streptomyces TaxID=2593676 RepID=UPI0036AC9B69